jgi:uncharacterized protein YkwD
MVSRTARLPVALVFVLWGCTSPVAPDSMAAAEAGAGAAAAGVSGSIVDLTNVERARAGVAPLRANAQLMRAAQLHAEQMASLGRLGHVLDGARYRSPQDRLSAAGYRWSAYAENVAYGQNGPQDVTESWMTSAGHRANMLNAAYTELGTGYAVDAKGRPYFVQVFGKPA